MATMFMEASSFNGDLSSFSTSGVTSMDTMFYYASSFEGKGLESWDTSSVVVFDRMFAGAIAFRGDGLSNWNVGNAQFMDKMVRKNYFIKNISQLFPAVRRSRAFFSGSL
jgi:membrane protease subunit (stomatin/prohibitin family)